MKRFLAAAVAILATVATVGMLAGLMMSFNHGGKDPVRKAQGTSRPAISEDVVVTVGMPQVKQFALAKDPVKLADAGKACHGQADCIGNCMADKLPDGKWSGPRCQAYAQPLTCGPLFDGGRYYWIPCPVY